MGTPYLSLRGAERRGNPAAKYYEFAENQCKNVKILRDCHGRKRPRNDMIGGMAQNLYSSINRNLKTPSAEWQRELLLFFVIDMTLNAINDHFKGNQILAAFENDKVCIFLTRLDKLLMHRLDCGQILI